MDLLNDNNGFSDQQNGQDLTEVFSSNNVIYSEGCNENDDSPDEPVYQTPVHRSADDKSETVNTSNLEEKLVCIKREIYQELDKETKTAVNRLEGRILESLREIKQEMKIIKKNC